jgi:hypothetical protein
VVASRHVTVTAISHLISRHACAGLGTDDDKLVRMVTGLKRNTLVHQLLEAMPDKTGAADDLLTELQEEMGGPTLLQVRILRYESTGHF